MCICVRDVFVYVYAWECTRVYGGVRVRVLCVYIYIYIYIFYMLPEARAIFLNRFTMCSSCKQEFVDCPIVNEERNGLNGLAHLRGIVTCSLSRLSIVM